MTPSPKPLSPAELAKLEHAFAADPASDAYRPLAEAYLAAGRFMEAMVVCKKGVKAHPSDSAPRLLLARVYADQGKDKKAIEELTGALAQFDKDKAVLRTLGALQLKNGEAEPGKQNLLKALELDPSDEETRAAMAQYKVAAPAKAAPPPADPPPPVLTPVAPGTAPAAAPARTASQTSIPAAAPSPARTASKTSIPAAGSPPRTASQPSMRAAAPARTQSQSAMRAQSSSPPAARERYEVDEEDEDEPVRRKGGGNAQKLFFGLLGLAVVGVVAFYVLGQMHAKKVAQLHADLSDASDQLKHDSYDAYIKVCKDAEAALQIEPDNTAAHAYLAYAYTIRWGEHGGGDEAHTQAQQNLAAAMKSGEEDSHIYAAQALLDTYEGNGAKAMASLQQKVTDLETQHRSSSLMYLTLGLIQMDEGDLDHARDSLQKAQEKAPSDPRVYAALGNLYRRLGQELLALQNFQDALQFEHKHPESLLGRALVLLDVDSPNFPLAATELDKLLALDPAPSPRQLATAHLARALLVARLEKVYPTLKADEAKKLAQVTSVPNDKSADDQLVQQEEAAGFNLDRQNPELHLIKSRRLWVDGQTDAAIAELHQAIKLDPTRANFYVELAKDLMQKPGGEAEAETALTKALKTMGPSPKLQLMLGEAYRKENKLDQALGAFKDAVADPKAKNPDALLEMAQIYKLRHDLPKAEDSANKAAEQFLGRPEKVAEAYALLGQITEAKGERKKADDFYQRALNASQEYAEGYYFYARFLDGDRKSKKKAHTLAQEYLRRDPHGAYAADAARM